MISLNQKIIWICLLVSFSSYLFGSLFQGSTSCGCGCEKDEMDNEFLLELKQIENKCSFDFYITSGYRCRSFNQSLIGAYSNSSHLYGLAVDIRYYGDMSNVEEVRKLAEESNYFTRVYYEGDHIHIEKRPGDISFIYKDLSESNYYVYNEDDGNRYLGLVYNQNSDQSLRLGYFMPLDDVESNINFFVDKLIKPSDSSIISNQLALGVGWSTFVMEVFDFYGLKISAGTGKAYSDKYYYLEPAISMGFISDYWDFWINLGYTLPIKADDQITKEVKKLNISLNFNLGNFNYW
tara:strand:+ start:62 stop:940 length:879 start_codon:yes stop_codon:yes gene_type:complete